MLCGLFTNVQLYFKNTPLKILSGYCSNRKHLRKGQGNLLKVDQVNSQSLFFAGPLPQVWIIVELGWE